MSIAIRQRDSDVPLTDALIFDHLGRQVEFLDGSLNSNTLSDKQLASMLQDTGFEQVEDDTAVVTGFILPQALPKAM